MAKTQLEDVWEPDLWVEGSLEKETSFAHLFNSPAVVEVDRLNTFASGPGSLITMPFLSDLTDTDDSVQKEGSPIPTHKHSSGKPRAAALEREWGYSASALSSQRSGMDPVGAMLLKLALGRVKRRQKALLAMLRGLFGESVAGAFYANSKEDFSESVAGTTADHLIDADKFFEANSLLGEVMMQSEQGIIWMHTDIETALRKQDENAFKTVSLDGGLTIDTYKKMPIYLSKNLVRPGTTDGLVYDTYVLGAGTFGYGAKPQVGDKIDVASLQFDPNKPVNEESVFDRVRYSLYVDGTSFDGSPVDDSPSNAEFQTEGNWTQKFSSIENIRMFRIRTNG